MISGIARTEQIDRTYTGDILRLTLLAPAIPEAIVDGLQPVEMTPPMLMKPFQVEWGRNAQAISQPKAVGRDVRVKPQTVHSRGGPLGRTWLEGN